MNNIVNIAHRRVRKHLRTLPSCAINYVDLARVKNALFVTGVYSQLHHRYNRQYHARSSSTDGSQSAVPTSIVLQDLVAYRSVVTIVASLGPLLQYPI